jgi:hypothetical protein
MFFVSLSASGDDHHGRHRSVLRFNLAISAMVAASLADGKYRAVYPRHQSPFIIPSWECFVGILPGL